MTSDLIFNAITSGENVAITNVAGRGPLVLVCEHASNNVPEEFVDLGLGKQHLNSHIAWDPGALAVAMALSVIFDAPLVATAVSRLVYDCNRPPEAPDAIAEKSEIYDIPGNVGLDQTARQARAEKFYHPFRRALEAVIDMKEKNAVSQATQPPAVISLHSFTPVYKNRKRDFDLGVLHGIDRRLADRVLTYAALAGELTTRRNEPYGPGDGVLHTMTEHAVPRGIPNVMIEIRTDIISNPDQQAAISSRLACYLEEALVDLGVMEAHSVSGTQSQ
ncbi:MAG: N-formylglutamate amidohydrolase [Verrucomicrobia bacterium]|nr:N-formylglutamate amidohydrolase [Verrucomicrobiota bacterium]MBT5161344.1 N-formylglutamate amidohydrolase [Alphaproteobacteria bacterium]